ncbi:MAG TPA: hypothetical protein PK008_05025 [Aminivibrio sp.]|uniref:hypothetical protein n=1 Tax=Aminivibrio sp. TaxID=1872489 RepID=UPI002CAB5C1C|nr:hypothetical protein [Aminivibrio sp.]HPF84763.1 hypothetical protein [Aminivibrio sp.]
MKRSSPSSRYHGNGAYAVLQYLEDGELLFNAFSGPIRVQYDTGGSGGCSAGGSFAPLPVLLLVPLALLAAGRKK